MNRQPRSVLITGSSRGIGNQLAQRMLARGDTVYGCARTAPSITHDNYTHFVADVADDVAVREMFRHISAVGTGLQLVVNNAGLSHTGLAILTGSQEAEKVILANLLGAFLISREAIKLMKRAGFGPRKVR